LTAPLPRSSNSVYDPAAKVRWISAKSPRRENVVRIARQGSVAGRVLIVDRDSMSGDLLANALVRDTGYEAAVVQAPELLGALAASDADLVVIGAEVNLKSGTGFDLAQSVALAHPNIAIVMLLTRANHASVINAFRSGARGVFSRQQSMSEFLDCVEHVSKGFIWAGRSETDFLLSAVRNIPSPSVLTAIDSPRLTARELEVVQYASIGKTNKMIAGELGLSEHTVKNYLFRAFEKLGVSSRIELLFYLTVRGHTLNAAKSEDAAPEFGDDGEALGEASA
jgi:two-component system, NarL family, nitrate/nitrite response regulator NarL